MFGGVGLYCQGLFFALIDDDTLYLKVDDATRPEFERLGIQPFRPYGDESQGMQYYELPADVLEDHAGGAAVGGAGDRGGPTGRREATRTSAALRRRSADQGRLGAPDTRG